MPVEPPSELTEGLPPLDTWTPHTHDALTASWLVRDVRIVRHGPLVGPDRAGEWARMPRPTGEPAARPDLHPRPDALAHHVGVALRRWHDTTRADGDALAMLRTHLRDRVGAIDPASLPDPYNRYDAARLVSLVDEGLDERLAGRPQVAVHGAPTLDRFLADPAGATTLLDGPIGMGDAHHDLAVVHRSVHTVLGPGAVFEFYDGYGIEPDLVLLDRFTLAALLVG